jgi:predicted transcriptional regulator of viral defense system
MKSFAEHNALCYFPRMISDILSAAQWIREQASRGHYHFSTEQAREGLGGSRVAVQAALRRLKKKGAVATPQRGFHVIVPPEYHALGCLPPEQFIPQLMEYLGQPYYAGLLTAARYQGAAHQQPQVFQVLVARKRLPIQCGRVSVEFVTRHNVAEMPKDSIRTPRGPLWLSSPEGTAFDLVGYPHHSGGLNNVATVLAELAEKLDPSRLIAAAPLSPLPWVQRLGYLLDLVGEVERANLLARYVADSAVATTPLVPALDHDRAPRDARWKLVVNVAVEPDL